MDRLAVPGRFSAEFYLLNRTLGIYDTLAMYVRRGIVPRAWVLDMWHHPMGAMLPGAEKIARRRRPRRAHRKERQDTRTGSTCQIRAR